MRNTFLWVGRNIFSRPRGERPLPKRLGCNWKWFNFQMCFRNIQITKTENCVLKAVQQIKCADIKGWLFFHIVLNLNLCEQASHFVQKYTRGRRRGHTWGWGVVESEQEITRFQENGDMFVVLLLSCPSVALCRHCVITTVHHCGLTPTATRPGRRQGQLLLQTTHQIQCSAGTLLTGCHVELPLAPWNGLTQKRVKAVLLFIRERLGIFLCFSRSLITLSKEHLGLNNKST